MDKRSYGSRMSSLGMLVTHSLKFLDSGTHPKKDVCYQATAFGKYWKDYLSSDIFIGSYLGTEKKGNETI